MATACDLGVKDKRNVRWRNICIEVIILEGLEEDVCWISAEFLRMTAADEIKPDRTTVSTSAA